MIEILRRIFFENWLRKIISLFVATVIWFVVHDSLSTHTSVTSTFLSLFTSYT